MFSLRDRSACLRVLPRHGPDILWNDGYHRQQCRAVPLQPLISRVRGHCQKGRRQVPRRRRCRVPAPADSNAEMPAYAGQQTAPTPAPAPQPVSPVQVVPAPPTPQNPFVGYTKVRHSSHARLQRSGRLDLHPGRQLDLSGNAAPLLSRVRGHHVSGDATVDTARRSTHAAEVGSGHPRQ